MSKYYISLINKWQTEIEADSEDEALDIAFDNVHAVTHMDWRVEDVAIIEGEQGCCDREGAHGVCEWDEVT